MVKGLSTFGSIAFTVLLSSAGLTEEPAVIKDCETCPELVIIDASGSFTMGAEQGEGDAWGMLARMSSNERPTAEVTIAKPYAIGRTEVTKAQFAAFVQETGFKTKKGCFHLTSSGWSMQPKLSWNDEGIGSSDDHPVPCLRRAEMLAYMDWLGSKTGYSYRFPSEAEWEYAARAGAPYPTFWGEHWKEACAFQNGADQSFVKVAPDIPYGQFADCDDGYAFTSPVGAYEPNAFGLYDVAGNVSEWTADCYADGHAEAPKDGSPVSKRRCRAWVAKGGSWAGFPGLLRVATRLRILGTTTGSGFGFRIARDVN